MPKGDFSVWLPTRYTIVYKKRSDGVKESEIALN